MSIEPFTVAIDDAVLDDLQQRLRRTRLPHDINNADWRYGTSTAYLAELIEYWLEEYDWRRIEAQINSFANYRTEIDDLPVHFIREEGRGPDPVPLILSHGWPWTFWDFRDVIGPLSDPVAHGGEAADCFDVIVPSLPGFGFSTPLKKPGINFWRNADLWHTLMTEKLGYDSFAAQGGDWGALITSQLGHKYSASMIGIHLSLSTPLDLFTSWLPGEEAYADDEKELFRHTQERMKLANSHVAVQCADPQTIAAALHDSPAGLLAWLVERRRNWSAAGADIESVFSKEDLITVAMIYWVTESYVTSARYYWEAAVHTWSPSHDRQPVVEAPTAVAIFPMELILMPRSHHETYYNLKQRTLMPAGGHFAPAEQPGLLVEDIRRFFRTLR